MTSLVLNPKADSPQLATALLGAMAASLRINTPKQFIAWTAEELQSILPHEAMVAGLLHIERRQARVRKMLNHNFPPMLLNTAVSRDGALRCAVFSKWVSQRSPQLVNGSQAVEGNAAEWIRAFRHADLQNIAAHGVRDAAGAASYFSFSNIPGPLEDHHAQLLQLIMPHMHLALVRALAKEKCIDASTREPGSLSARQQEALYWLQMGKTNAEIAQILEISPNTVKNLVRSILVKLRVNNRTHAVTRARQFQII